MNTRCGVVDAKEQNINTTTY